MLDFISLSQLSNYLSIYTDLFKVINVLSSVYLSSLLTCYLQQLRLITPCLVRTIR